MENTRATPDDLVGFKTYYFDDNEIADIQSKAGTSVAYWQGFTTTIIACVKFGWYLIRHPWVTTSVTLRGFYDFFLERGHGCIEAIETFTDMTGVFIRNIILVIAEPYQILVNSSYIPWRMIMMMCGDRASTQFMWIKARRTNEPLYSLMYPCVEVSS